MVHDNFRQLIAQNRVGKIHALQIATEDSLRAVQERSKKGITGRLRDVACAKIDEQTEALVEMIGENQIDYRFFLGFKLLESKISRRFQFRRLDKNNFGYLLEHIYGNTGIAYNDYSYELPVI